MLERKLTTYKKVYTRKYYIRNPYSKHKLLLMLGRALLKKKGVHKKLLCTYGYISYASMLAWKKLILILYEKKIFELLKRTLSYGKL